MNRYNRGRIPHENTMVVGKANLLVKREDVERYRMFELDYCQSLSSVAARPNETATMSLYIRCNSDKQRDGVIRQLHRYKDLKAVLQMSKRMSWPPSRTYIYHRAVIASVSKHTAPDSGHPDHSGYLVKVDVLLISVVDASEKFELMIEVADLKYEEEQNAATPESG